MAYSYTDKSSNIKFTNIPNVGLKGLNYKPMYGGNDFEYSDDSQADPDAVEPFINAVEIDWNGAKLGSTTINTTGQFLSYVSNIGQAADAIQDVNLSFSKVTAADQTAASEFISEITVTNTGNAYTISYTMSPVDFSYLANKIDTIMQENENLSQSLGEYTNCKIVKLISAPVIANNPKKNEQIIATGGVVENGYLLYTLSDNTVDYLSQTDYTQVKINSTGNYTLKYVVKANSEYGHYIPEEYNTVYSVDVTVTD